MPSFQKRSYFTRFIKYFFVISATFLLSGANTFCTLGVLCSSGFAQTAQINSHIPVVEVESRPRELEAFAAGLNNQARQSRVKDSTVTDNNFSTETGLRPITSPQQPATTNNNGEQSGRPQFDNSAPVRNVRGGRDTAAKPIPLNNAAQNRVTTATQQRSNRPEIVTQARFNSESDTETAADTETEANDYAENPEANMRDTTDINTNVTGRSVRNESIKDQREPGFAKENKSAVNTSPASSGSSIDALGEFVEEDDEAEQDSFISKMMNAKDKTSKMVGFTSKKDIMPLVSVVGTLCLVLGCFFVFAMLLKKVSPKTGGYLPREAFECVGRFTLNSKLQLNLLRLGNRLILIAVTQDGGLETITEVEHPDEVVQILGMCRKLDPNSSTAQFKTVLNEFAQEKTSGGFFGFDQQKQPRRAGKSQAQQQYSLSSMLSSGNLYG
ncbi:MAG: hypothetical protein ACRC2T_08890 [Thermoguttaceae bacterium]